MKVMFFCRGSLYERLISPVVNQCEVSPPLANLNEVTDWIYTANGNVDLLVIDTGLPSYETICSLPYRNYKYEGDPHYETVIVDLISTMKLEKKRASQSYSPLSTERKPEATIHEEVLEKPVQPIEPPADIVEESVVEPIEEVVTGPALDRTLAEPAQTEQLQVAEEVFEVPVMPESVMEARNPFGFLTQAIGKGWEVIEQVKNHSSTKAKLGRDPEQRSRIKLASHDPWQCLAHTPRRVVCYSPKGGAGATSITLELADMFDAGVIEISTRYGQLAGKLGAQPVVTLEQIIDGSEDEAVWKNRFVFSPWVYPGMKEVNEAEIKTWLMRGERAFPDRMLLIDLMSQSSLVLLRTILEWGAKQIWVMHDTPDHLGMADLQLNYLLRECTNRNKIGVLIQEITGQRFPWEETLGVKVIGHIKKEMGTKEWKEQVRESILEWLTK